MTVLEVLETASLYLNLREELDYYFNEDNLTTPSEEDATKFNNLLRALNLTVKEVGTEFKNLYYEENITFENNKANISSLSQTLFKIVEIRDEFQTFNFNIIDDYILINSNGTKTIRYITVPEDLTKDDNIYFFDAIYEKPLALGTCMEYYYINNIFDEAKVWEERFYKSLQNCLRGIGSYNMPKRRWL